MSTNPGANELWDMLEEAEEWVENQRRHLAGLTGQEREVLYWRICRQEQQLEVARNALREAEDQRFIVEVLGDLGRL
jgi:hypothetical protein